GEVEVGRVARVRALDEYRTGQRVHLARIERGEVGDRGGGCDLTVQRVERLERDLLAFADLECRSDVGVIAVMPAIRLVAERLAAIDADGVHGGNSQPGGLDRIAIATRARTGSERRYCSGAPARPPHQPLHRRAG